MGQGQGQGQTSDSESVTGLCIPLNCRLCQILLNPSHSVEPLTRQDETVLSEGVKLRRWCCSEQQESVEAKRSRSRRFELSMKDAGRP